MANTEEQDEEIEVLMSIYPEEFEWISMDGEDSNPLRKSFKVRLEPSIDTGAGEEMHVTANLRVQYVEGYPSDCIPDLSIEPVKGLGPKQVEELLELAKEKSEEEMGGPSVFGVCEALKEWLLDNNVPGQDGSMYAEMMRREQMKGMQSAKQEKKASLARAADKEINADQIDPEEQERIRKRQAGQPVTEETFNAWKVLFEQELLEGSLAAEAAGETLTADQESRLKGIRNTHDQPTGKELFLRNKGVVGVEEGDIADVEGDEDKEGVAAAEAYFYEQMQKKRKEKAEGAVIDEDGEDGDGEEEGESLGSEDSDSDFEDGDSEEYVDDDDEDSDGDFAPSSKPDGGGGGKGGGGKGNGKSSHATRSKSGGKNR